MCVRDTEERVSPLFISLKEKMMQPNLKLVSEVK